MVPLANYYAVAGPVDPKTAAPEEQIPLANVPIEGAAGEIPGKTLNTPGALVSGFSPDEPAFPQQEQIPQPAPHALAPTEQKAAAAPVVAKSFLTPEGLPAGMLDHLEGNIAGLVRKSETTGVTSDTGLTGVDLKGRKPDDDEDEDDDEKVTKELRQWRDLARGRAKAGKPQRRFVAQSIPSLTQHRVWKALESARTREEIDAAFEVAKSANPKVLTRR